MLFRSSKAQLTYSRWKVLSSMYRLMSDRGLSSAPESSNGVKDNGQSTLDLAYTELERKNILNCFNHSAHNKFIIAKHFSVMKAEAVIRSRNEHGPFQSLGDILKVPGIEILGLQHACVKLKTMDHDTLEKLHIDQHKERVRPYPAVSEEKCQSLSSVLSLDFQPDKISWLRMTRDLKVMDWKQITVFDKPNFKYDHVLYHNRLNEIVRGLPTASLYIMEQKLVRVQNLRTVPIVLNYHIIMALFITLLNVSRAGNEGNCVHLMKAGIIDRYFNLSIGGERVSGEHVVRDILAGILDQASGVSVPRDLADEYFTLKNIHRDRMAITLLQAVAFLKLVVLKSHLIV